MTVFKGRKTGGGRQGPGAAKPDSKSKGATRRKAVAPLPVRVTIAVVAVLLLAVAGFMGANISAINTYNQATNSLNQAISAYNNPDSDLQGLKTQQEQIDQEFQSASALDPLLLPSVKSSIQANRDVSQKLTQKTTKKLAKQEGKANANGTGRTGHSSNEAPGLSDEQRKQIEETLKANQPASGSQNNNSSSGTKDDSNKAKPW
ncbi:DUF6466 family protein [Bifidobacterium sp. ESL0790]|uniref:DUF6466 family protein n=1 Tax=Bifidobacterium sp. ESL0790 TaxID=2983233 RepID=UPI0023F9D41A|nr:DUF6466 family protein [Bifidobacterium sp. ESL0790]WEV71870.1 DUF6466 family protein [Bifidobacterium sp. ESL0790]